MAGAAGGSLVLAGGLLVDGTGKEPRPADVRVSADRVDAVSAPGTLSGDRTIDVTGAVVTPGFVDIHTHADFSLPTHPSASSMVRQGVTTLLVGNCGFSAFPVVDGERGEMLRTAASVFGRGLSWKWSSLPEFAAHLRRLGIAVNVGTLVGHGALRIAALGYDRREASPAELQSMVRWLDEAMEAGAFGLSSGLIYPPGSYAPTDELIALCRVVAARSGFYATHMRNEGEHLLHSVEETLTIARTAGVALQMSHHKVLGRRNWGLTRKSLAMVDEAVADGVDIYLDQYPYPASSTTMVALVPAWAAEGGTTALQSRLGDPTQRDAVRREVLEGPTDGRPKRDFEPETVLVSSVSEPEHRRYVGSRLDEIANREGREPVDVMLDLLARDRSVEVVIFAIGEEDIERVMRHERVAVASDGWTLHPDEGGCPHPRSYGTFARVLSRYVRERGVLTLPEAVRRMTSLPSDRMGLTDRGRVAPGARADLVVLDPDAVREEATFLAPHRFATGVQHVLVNGVPVVWRGAETGERPGEFLRSAGSSR